MHSWTKSLASKALVILVLSSVVACSHIVPVASDKAPPVQPQPQATVPAPPSVTQTAKHKLDDLIEEGKCIAERDYSVQQSCKETQ